MIKGREMAGFRELRRYFRGLNHCWEAHRTTLMPCLPRGVLQCVAVRCSALQCVAVCCSALQCVAAHCAVVCCNSLCCNVWGVVEDSLGSRRCGKWG